MSTSARLANRGAFFHAPDLLAITVGAAFLLGTVLRFTVGRDLPLWIDEAWTGAIAGQDTFRATLHQSLLDANAPAYFVLMHFWTQLFGLSATSLRFPSFVFGMIAPLLALNPTRGIDRSVRLIWCGLLALWIPEIWYAQEARCYSLAFLLATACTLVFVRLLAQPGLRIAAGWALLGTLAILTHYYFLLLVGCQGLVYLAVHRTRALRTWPAALLFLPAFAWIGVHAPRLMQFADSNAAFAELLDVHGFFAIIVFLIGDNRLALVLLIVAPILGMLAWWSNLRTAWGKRPDAQTNAWLAFGATAAGVIVMACIGAFRPSLTIRYLMGFGPGILFGLALAAAWLGRRWSTVPVGIVVLFGIFACAWSFRFSEFEFKSVWNFEQASREWEKHGVDQIVFFYDSPQNKVFEPSQLEALGGFFFKRDGLPVRVTPIFLQPGDDPNVRLLAAATSSRPAILWFYELGIRETAAESHPPRIEQIDLAWICNKRTKDSLGLVACRRK